MVLLSFKKKTIYILQTFISKPKILNEVIGKFNL